MEAVAVVTKGLTPEEVEDLRDSFGNFDKNKDGSIDEAELAVVLRSLGYSPTKEQLQKLMKKVDLDGSGGITFDEFVMMMRLGDMQTDFEREIIDAFDFFDKNKDGMVDRKELSEIMRGLGDKLTDEEIRLLLDAADQNQDGTISMSEFISFMYS